MDTEVADAVKDKRSLKGLGNRPIKGYDGVMPVFESRSVPKTQADGK